MDLGLEGKKALVTGADSGIGWHTARALLQEGATVIMTDRDQGKLDEAVERLAEDVTQEDPTGSVHVFAADVTDTADVAELHRRSLAAVGRIDIVVNAAGITGAQGDFSDIDDAGWLHTIETDLLGPVRVAREFLPDLRRGWGRLVFISSEDAVQPYADELPYCAAKAGVLALAKGLSRAYAEDGLLVNTVSPAFIATPMTDAMMEERAEQNGTSFDEAVRSFLETERPFLELKRRGLPEEVASVVAFLCSDAASFVNGSNYRVDGGSVATI
ncbi:SDR family NAD(P)-dependent oxidoreductase [Rathayibacter sp. CAU 1779]